MKNTKKSRVKGRVKENYIVDGIWIGVCCGFCVGLSVCGMFGFWAVLIGSVLGIALGALWGYRKEKNNK